MLFSAVSILEVSPSSANLASSNPIFIFRFLMEYVGFCYFQGIEKLAVSSFQPEALHFHSVYRSPRKCHDFYEITKG